MKVCEGREFYGGVTFAKYFIFRGVFLAASSINLGPFQERSAADAKEI